MSFAKGSLIDSTAVNELKTLCDSKCIEAGIATSGLSDVVKNVTKISSAWFSTLITTHNTCVVESTDDSTAINSVISGNKIEASVFSNMKTQFENMTFSSGGDKGIFAAQIDQENNIFANTIEYVTIKSAGNSSDFGDINASMAGFMAATSNGSGDIGVYNLAYTDEGFVNSLSYITISSNGDASVFGELVSPGPAAMGACSNGSNDRGVWACGYDGTTFYNNIDYLTISSTGDSSAFGILSSGEARIYIGGSSNATGNRGIFAGGGLINGYCTIEYITIISLGDATDFGDLTNPSQTSASCSNGTNNRSVIQITQSATKQNGMDYINITSIGNASSFGELNTLTSLRGSTSNATGNVGLFAGGETSSSTYNCVNTIDQINISSLGDASDFGDLLLPSAHKTGTSNA